MYSYCTHCSSNHRSFRGRYLSWRTTNLRSLGPRWATEWLLTSIFTLTKWHFYNAPVHLSASGLGHSTCHLSSWARTLHLSPELVGSDIAPVTWARGLGHSKCHLSSLARTLHLSPKLSPDILLTGYITYLAVQQNSNSTTYHFL